MAKGDMLYKKALRFASSDVPRNKLALEYLEKAVAKGNAKATYALATWYLHGKEVRKDLEKGIELMKYASSKGVSEAFFDLAVSFEKGVGVKKDELEAFKNYMLSSISGDKEAIYELGRCFFYGIGVEKDKKMGEALIEYYNTLG